ncbi:type II toxin-antitoxin system RelE/ParE family toxin [Escherichia coli]|uniref:type II toxin-antitoxin system RelE/ParE family toxin n=1 Tax=Escherichia coli TaxID=562 RepID=UPI0020330EDD|nr:type II toxin-antitoxin system RelE/ParE family toxin [Escherichia coli]MDP4340138.1 type II toxin-antitoxin system RelE/ParE family toxin [Escherichia coli]MDP4366608.1 type II toxin-antitoxin system RelE/ParE family toxin [Escherichia coli]
MDAIVARQDNHHKTLQTERLLIKQRLPRVGGGKSGGYRTIIFYRVGTRAFFVYAYAKNERENITATEESAFRKGLLTYSI